MLTFLKKLGTILANAAGIAVGIGPLIKPFLGSGVAATVVATGTNDLLAISQVVVTAEAMFQTPSSGAQKLSASVPLIMSILKTSELVSGKKIADEHLFEQAAQKITSGMADLLNSISPDAAQHSSSS